MPNIEDTLFNLLCESEYMDWDSKVAYLIANGVTVQGDKDANVPSKWISVKDRLPKPFTPVLVYRKSFGTLPPYIKVDKMTLWSDDTQVWTDEVGNWKNVTTHWMPLPSVEGLE